MRTLKKQDYMNVVIVHGVNTPSSDPWENEFSWLYTIPYIKVTALEWPSKSFMGDGLKWLLSGRYRDRVANTIADNPIWQEEIDLIITHSFGQIVMNEFFWICGEPDCHVINIAGPLTNPVLSFLYGKQNYDLEFPRTAILNPDDSICAFRRRWIRFSDDVEYIPIELSTRDNEHPVSFYLDDRKVRAKIIALLSKRRSERKFNYGQY